MGLTVCGQPVSTLSSCPSDNELILFFGANTPTGLAFRTWAQIKQCLGAKPPIAGVVGASGMPVSGTSVYQDNRLIGLGSSNGGNISFSMAGSTLYNYGTTASFEFNNTTGTISLLFGNEFTTGDAINIDLNQ
jgi:hypothetical protein